MSVPANAELRAKVKIVVSTGVALSWKLPPCATGSWEPAAFRNTALIVTGVGRVMVIGPPVTVPVLLTVMV